VRFIHELLVISDQYQIGTWVRGLSLTNGKYLRLKMFNNYEKQRLKQSELLATKIKELKTLEELTPHITPEQLKQKEKLMLNLDLATRTLRRKFDEELTKLELKHIQLNIELMREIGGTVSITDKKNENKTN